MNQKSGITWFSIVGTIGISFGIFYSIFGLSGFPAYDRLIPKDVITPWSNGLYGSTFIGFSVLLFFMGRYAFKKSDKVLMRYLLYGIYAWLIVEAAFSFYHGVYFNLGVDLVLAITLGYPLFISIKSKH